MPATPPAAVDTWVLRTTDPSVLVPQNFVGIHRALDNPTWKGEAVVPAPTYSYGYVRTLKAEVDGLEERGHWSNIEVSPGVYDWQYMDQWMLATVGHPVIWLIDGIPLWYQKYPGEPTRWGDEQQNGISGGLDETNPAAVAALRAYVKAARERYPGRIAAFEILNEPTLTYDGAINDYTSRWDAGKIAQYGLQDPPFFLGSASDAVNIAYIVRTSDRAGIPVIGYAWVDQTGVNQHSVVRILNAPVTVPGGSGTGKDQIDAASIHKYDYDIEHNPQKHIDLRDGYKAKFSYAGIPNIDVYVTEGAKEEGANGLPALFTQNDARAPNSIMSWIILEAGLGRKMFGLYGHLGRWLKSPYNQRRDDRVKHLGDPVGSPAVAQAIGDAYTIGGKELIQVAILVDGRAWAETSTGGIFLTGERPTAGEEPPDPPVTGLPPSVEQQSDAVYLDEDGTNEGSQYLVLPDDIAAGSTILVAASSWNYEEQGGVISGCTDLGGSSYGPDPIINIESTAQSHLRLEVFAASAVAEREGGTTITVNFARSNGYNRATLVALVCKDIDLSGIEASSIGLGGGSTNSTQASAEMPNAPSMDGALLLGFAALMWPDSPKNWNLPAGTSAVHTDATTTGVQLALQISAKTQTSAAAESWTWQFSQQQYGAAVALLALRPVTVKQVIRVEADEDAVNAAAVKVSVFALPTSADDMHGPHLFQARGSDITVAKSLNANGGTNLTIKVPAGQALANDQQVMVIGRGENPADADALWGSNFLTGTVGGENKFKLSVSAGGLLDYQSNPIKLRGINMYAAAIPYHLPHYYEDQNNGFMGDMDGVTKFCGSQATLQWVKTKFGQTFNAVRINVSPLALRQTVPGTYDYPLQKQQLDAFADYCETEGVWVIFCPYGMGRWGDFESRARKNQDAANGNAAGNPAFANDDDANQPPEDATMDEYNANRLQDGTASTVAESWMTTEVMAAQEDAMAWAADKPNVLLQLLSEPRNQTDATWQAQNVHWLTNARRVDSPYPAERPIFIHGPGWAERLPAAGVTALRAIDENICFGEDHYGDQGDYSGGGGNPVDEQWPEYADAEAAGACVGVLEWGPSYSGANFGQPLTYYEGWADDYHADLGAVPFKFYWMALWDNNSIFGDPTVSGQEDWHTGTYNVTENATARELNKWAEQTVIVKNAL